MTSTFHSLLLTALCLSIPITPAAEESSPLNTLINAGREYGEYKAREKEREKRREHRKREHRRDDRHDKHDNKHHRRDKDHHRS